jgi:hypothetical protein
MFTSQTEKIQQNTHPDTTFRGTFWSIFEIAIYYEKTHTIFGVGFNRNHLNFSQCANQSSIGHRR